MPPVNPDAHRPTLSACRAHGRREGNRGVHRAGRSQGFDAQAVAGSICPALGDRADLGKVGDTDQ